MSNCRQKDFLLGTLVGGTLATLSVMLFTTKKGKQLQRQITDACEDVKDAFFQAKDKAEEVGEEALDSGEHLTKKAVHKVKHDTHSK